MSRPVVAVLGAHRRRAARDAVVVVAAAAAALFASVALAVNVNLVSDEHYDPAYGTANAYGACTTLTAAPPLGKAGCDSSPTLIAVSSADMALQNTAYTFYGGDWQRHGMSSSVSSSDIFTRLAQFFAVTTPSAPDDTFNVPRITSVLGNNDVIPDYHFNITEQPNELLKTEIGILQQFSLLNTTQGQVMAKCGYYSGVASANLRVLALHTLVWTFRMTPVLADTVTDPCGQLAWMQSEIAAARAAGQKVIIIGHIPPQPNVFGVIQTGATGTVQSDMYWKPMYQEAYTTLVSNNKDIITLQLFGHTHRFSILGDADMGVPLIVMNAITPIYGNVPAYLIAGFNKSTWKMTSLTQRFTPEPYVMWGAGMEAGSALGISDLSDVSAIRSSISQMFTNDTLFETYMTLRTGGVIDDPCTTTFCRVYTVCAMMYASHDNLLSCVDSQMGSSSSSSSSSSVAPLDPSVHITTHPQYHIRPPTNWINDPSGPFRDPVTGKIHLYMQYNPSGPLWGNTAWYHMTSDDYVKWASPETPVAMFADKWYDEWGAYSGTMMNNNYSEPVVFYTCAEPDNIQRQCIATIPAGDLAGKRTLNTFEKSPLNPILTEDSVPGLVGLGNFRHPTEWWQDPANPGQWLVAFVARVQDSDGDNAHVVVFSTTDPTFHSGYSYSHSLYVYKYDVGKMLECPSFFTLQDGGEHYLKVSTMPSHRDYIVYGSYQASNASSSQYVFVEDPARTFTFVDYGPFYASRTFHDPVLNRRMMWGWTDDELSDAQIASQGWSGVQNMLRGIEYDSVEQKLKTFPIPELKGLRLAHLYAQPPTAPLQLTTDGTPLTLIAAGTNATSQHEIVVTFTLSSMAPFDGTTYYTDSTAPEFGVMIRASANYTNYTTVSVRMPAATQQPVANRAQDTASAPIKMYPAASTSPAANCSAECAKDRTCVSWTYTVTPQPTCALYWMTSGRVRNTSAQSGTVNIPHLYMGRTQSGSIGSTQPLLGRAALKQTQPNVVKLRIFVDDSVVEVFKDGGLETMTGRLYLPSGAAQTGIALYAKNLGAVTVTASVDIFSMDTAFAAPAGPSVVRNYTDGLYALLTAMGVER